MITITEINKHIETIDKSIMTLTTYLLCKVNDNDWHGVADAAMDIRDLEAKKKVYQSLKDK